PMLKVKPADCYSDATIGTAVSRLNNIRKQFSHLAYLPTYRGILEEVLQDEAVKNVRGALEYKDAFGINKHRRSSQLSVPRGTHPLARAMNDEPILVDWYKGKD
ncbi:MAG: hypothetical protein ABIH34_01605, partial [Nanoarchaeota archaeon]